MTIARISCYPSAHRLANGAVLAGLKQVFRCPQPEQARHAAERGAAVAEVAYGEQSFHEKRRPRIESSERDLPQLLDLFARHAVRHESRALIRAVGEVARDRAESFVMRVKIG